MIHITDIDVNLNGSAVTLGKFDGLHIGHRKLIEIVKQQAEKLGLSSVVFSFRPHPKFLFDENFSTLLSHEEKFSLMKQMDIDYYLEYPFSYEFSAIEPAVFIEDILIKKLSCRCVVVGENFRFGKDKKGDTALLAKYESDGLKLIVVPSQSVGDIVVSSTEIRRQIAAKDFQKAEKMLGYPYFVSGTVEYGKKLGRTLGFPTVNIYAPDNKTLPPNGVYITKTLHNGGFYKGVSNVGINPTVEENGTRRIETFLIDFQQEIYGDTINVYFYEFIRDEMKFTSVPELKAQISADAEYAKSRLL